MYDVHDELPICHTDDAILWKKPILHGVKNKDNKKNDVKLLNQ
jgi:hypothetical protein